MSIDRTDSKISVIIVTRDRAWVLPACLDSLACQSPAPHQIVLVAGSGTSVPPELMEQYRDLPIVLVECLQSNISIARNIGLDHAEGELVIFIDDDAQAHSGLIRAYLDAFQAHPEAWAAGGAVFDSRRTPPTPEFTFGVIRPSGVQIEVRDPRHAGVPRGYLASVKGCNFALHRGRIPIELRFDPFFAFAFDEADLIMHVHEQGGTVVHVPGAVVDHAHTPGMYRALGPMDRDWRTEFASHTKFMLKHAQGSSRRWGWCVVLRRLCKHISRALLAALFGRISPSRARSCITQAFAGIRHALASHDSDRSSR